MHKDNQKLHQNDTHRYIISMPNYDFKNVRLRFELIEAQVTRICSGQLGLVGSNNGLSVGRNIVDWAIRNRPQ